MASPRDLPQTPAIISAIAQRHSVRAFIARPIPYEYLMSILNAGIRAPSAKNRQPWHFFVITDRCQIDDLAKRSKAALATEIDPATVGGMRDPREIEKTLNALASAPVLTLVGYDQSRERETGNDRSWAIRARDREAVDLQSIGAAIENMALQAASLGIGCLWACDILTVHDAVQSFLQTDMPIVSAIAFGYELRESALSQRLSLEESVTWFGSIEKGCILKEPQESIMALVCLLEGGLESSLLKRCLPNCSEHKVDEALKEMLDKHAIVQKDGRYIPSDLSEPATRTEDAKEAWQKLAVGYLDMLETASKEKEICVEPIKPFDSFLSYVEQSHASDGRTLTQIRLHLPGMASCIVELTRSEDGCSVRLADQLIGKLIRTQFIQLELERGLELVQALISEPLLSHSKRFDSFQSIQHQYNQLRKLLHREANDSGKQVLKNPCIAAREKRNEADLLLAQGEYEASSKLLIEALRSLDELKKQSAYDYFDAGSALCKSLVSVGLARGDKRDIECFLLEGERCYARITTDMGLSMLYRLWGNYLMGMGPERRYDAEMKYAQAYRVSLARGVKLRTVDVLVDYAKFAHRQGCEDESAKTALDYAKRIYNGIDAEDPLTYANYLNAQGELLLEENPVEAAALFHKTENAIKSCRHIDNRTLALTRVKHLVALDKAGDLESEERTHTREGLDSFLSSLPAESQCFKQIERYREGTWYEW